MANWTEEDYAALMARRGVNDICAALNRRHMKKPRKTAKVVQKKISEHEEQVRLFEECAKNAHKYPGLELIHAIPNGGQRHPAVAKKLKAEGVKSGIPDIFLPVPRGNAHGLYVELKAVGGRVSDNQRAMLVGLARQGYACLVCYGWENAWREIESYMKSEIIQLGALV